MALGGSILPVFVTILGAFTASSSSITLTGNSPSNNSAPFGTITFPLAFIPLCSTSSSKTPSRGALWPFTMTADGPSHPVRRFPSFSCKLGDATDITFPVSITALILIARHTTSSVIRREMSISSTAASPESSSSTDTMPTVFRSSSSESRRLACQALPSSLRLSFLHLFSPSSRRSLRCPPFPSSFGPHFSGLGPSPPYRNERCAPLWHNYDR
ncbi:hypothetical protein OUZ56_032817 [Daphnia magna]|uniref:Secreted protein n=1 Tax=Daphnia magna TaxID=35525 RepID=A0ABQ9ZQ52_9CRUS|nr:hypothetical protein OUZ56_030036 [Daphnia magna]KAK4045279.1 hypothetical protein OUZ56_032817 [Daphnia magna]